MYTTVCGRVGAAAGFDRAGLRHAHGVRPNRAVEFRGPPFWSVGRCKFFQLVQAETEHQTTFGA